MNKDEGEAGGESLSLLRACITVEQRGLRSRLHMEGSLSIEEGDGMWTLEKRMERNKPLCQCLLYVNPFVYLGSISLQLTPYIHYRLKIR